MNTTKTAAIFLFAAIAAGASHAADPAVRDADRVRAQVRHELRQAIVAGDIRHGDLVDFQELVMPAASRRAVADRQERERAPADTGVAASQPLDGNAETFAHAASAPR